MDSLVLIIILVLVAERLDKKQKNTLLQLVEKRIIINREGEIISHKLHSPFSYFSALKSQKKREK